MLAHSAIFPKVAEDSCDETSSSSSSTSSSSSESDDGEGSAVEEGDIFEGVALATEAGPPETELLAGSDHLGPAASSGYHQHSVPPAPVSPAASASARGVAASVGSQLEDRGMADAAVFLENGKISFYEKGNRFECTCFRHPKCVLTRTGAYNARRKGQGRPVGLMAAWLEFNDHAAMASAEDHKNPFLVQGISKQARLAARRRLRAAEGPDIEARERGRTASEADSEPDAVP